jgi:hypothetical protein
MPRRTRQATGRRVHRFQERARPSCGQPPACAGLPLATVPRWTGRGALRVRCLGLEWIRPQETARPVDRLRGNGLPAAAPLLCPQLPTSPSRGPDRRCRAGSDFKEGR